MRRKKNLSDGTSRRETLRGLGAAGMVAVVGCGGGSGSGGPTTPAGSGGAGGQGRGGSGGAGGSGGSGSGGSGGAGGAPNDAATAAGPDGAATASGAEGGVAADGAAVSRDASTLSCVVRPEQTEGPFFIDEKLERSDIRSDPASGMVSAGLPLRLAFNVYQVNSEACMPLSGLIFDVWQCDAVGVYWDVSAQTQGKKFLRGFQTTNAMGGAEFTAIYPGWYPGRAVHGHFKIRGTVGGRAITFTSQYYFPDALTDQIHMQAPYAARGPRPARNNNDGIFTSGGSGARLILDLTKEASGYLGVMSIGLRMT
jgi:protocatechuate 3,4-dioxygenase beta subunit